MAKKQDSIQEELSRLDTTKFPAITKVIENYLNNPQARIYVSVSNFVNSICNEMDILSETEGHILNSEEKEFERMLSLIKNFEGINLVLSGGVKKETKKEEEGDFLEHNARKRMDKNNNGNNQ